MHGADPAAIGAARILEPLQVHAERGVELRHRARQHDGAPAGMLLNDGEPVRRGKFLDRGDVVGVGAELLRRTARAAQIAAGVLSPSELFDVFRQCAALRRRNRTLTSNLSVGSALPTLSRPAAACARCLSVDFDWMDFEPCEYSCELRTLPLTIALHSLHPSDRCHTIRRPPQAACKVRRGI